MRGPTGLDRSAVMAYHPHRSVTYTVEVVVEVIAVHGLPAVLGNSCWGTPGCDPPREIPDAAAHLVSPMTLRLCLQTRVTLLEESSTLCVDSSSPCSPDFRELWFSEARALEIILNQSWKLLLILGGGGERKSAEHRQGPSRKVPDKFSKLPFPRSPLEPQGESSLVGEPPEAGLRR